MWADVPTVLEMDRSSSSAFGYIFSKRVMCGQPTLYYYYYYYYLFVCL